MAQPSIAERIRHFARAAGKSQAQIATAMGVTSSAVAQWFALGKKGRVVEPTHENLARLVVVLGIDLATFYGPLSADDSSPPTDDGDEEGESRDAAAVV